MQSSEVWWLLQNFAIYREAFFIVCVYSGLKSDFHFADSSSRRRVYSPTYVSFSTCLIVSYLVFSGVMLILIFDIISAFRIISANLFVLYLFQNVYMLWSSFKSLWNYTLFIVHSLKKNILFPHNSFQFQSSKINACLYLSTFLFSNFCHSCTSLYTFQIIINFLVS